MTELFLGPSTNGKFIRLTVEEKQQICRYSDENPSYSFRKLAEIFEKKFEKSVSHTVIYRIKKNREKLMNNTDIHCVLMKDPKEGMLMSELKEEIAIRNTLTSDHITNSKHIRTLAFELAAQEKYGGYFANHRFGQTWVSNFRKLYNVPSVYITSRWKKPHDS